LIEKINVLRDAFREVKQQKPFQINAAVILPDHLHSTAWMQAVEQRGRQTAPAFAAFSINRFISFRRCIYEPYLAYKVFGDFTDVIFDRSLSALLENNLPKAGRKGMN